MGGLLAMTIRRAICSIFAVVLFATFFMISFSCFGQKAYADDSFNVTADQAIAWVKQREGTTIGDGQCVNLIAAYIRYLGSSPSPGNYASDYTTCKVPAGFTRIKGAQPKKGDILIWTTVSSYTPGHVGIYEADYSTWHQNVSGRMYVQKLTEYYTLQYWDGSLNYWGVMRPNLSDTYIPEPGKPNLSVNVGTSQQATTFHWNSTANTTYYTLRVFDSNDELILLQGGIEDTSYSALLPAGNYYAYIASVNTTYGNWTFSDDIEFSVPVDSSELPPSKPTIQVSSQNSLQETYFEWSVTTNTTYYTLRIYKAADDELYFMRGGLITNDFYLSLPAGDYYANVASVHKDDITWNWTFSDDVSFTVSSASTPSSGDLFMEVEENNKLYRLFDKECSWLEAESIANASSGRFVSITDENEQNVIGSMVAAFGSPCWLGGRLSSEDEWNWANGDEWSYSNWQEFQPDGGYGNENCLEILVDGTWNDHRASSVVNNSSDVKGYILEYYPIGLTVIPLVDNLEEGTPVSSSDVSVMVTFSDQSVFMTSHYSVSVSGTEAGTQTITVTYGDLTASTQIEYVKKPRTMQEPDFILPEQTITIEAQAFVDNDMEIVACNEGLQEIKEDAFMNCKHLVEIFIPESVQYIANDVFSGCSHSLTIFGYTGSVAQEFAELHGYQFIPVE